MKLYKLPHKEIIISDLAIADTMATRNKGLLGHDKLEANQAMWIHRCNAIHTFFMKFTIDAVFVNKSLKVVKIVSNIKPWRLTLPVIFATSVIEMAAGQANQLGIKKGDALYVDS